MSISEKIPKSFKQKLLTKNTNLAIRYTPPLLLLPNIVMTEQQLLHHYIQLYLSLYVVYNIVQVTSFTDLSK